MNTNISNAVETTINMVNGNLEPQPSASRAKARVGLRGVVGSFN